MSLEKNKNQNNIRKPNRNETTKKKTHSQLKTKKNLNPKTDTLGIATKF